MEIEPTEPEPDFIPLGWQAARIVRELNPAKEAIGALPIGWTETDMLIAIIVLKVQTWIVLQRCQQRWR